MPVCGIIAEYDPFHAGHAWQIQAVRGILGAHTAVVCAMSGNWTQRGAPALFPKHVRAQAALLGGADLVLELPSVWAVAPAETFARGGVALLDGTGVVTHLCFGSECGTLEPLQRAAHCLDSQLYAAGLRRFLDQGMPFAACRQAAVEELAGRETGAVLAAPNNNLGVEYLRALQSLHSPIQPMTVARQGAGHGQGPQDGFASAGHLRTLLRIGDWDGAAPYLSEPTAALLRSAPDARLERAERAVLARLRTMGEEDFAALPDAGGAEGLSRRLYQAARQARDLDEFFLLAKTRRYPLARLRRLVLWAFWGVRAEQRLERPPYLRVLGANQTGRALLREMKQCARIPVLTKPAHAHTLPGEGQALFELEGHLTDLYGLCRAQVPPCGTEWTSSPAMV